MPSAPHRVAVLAALVFVATACTGPAAPPAPGAPAATRDAAPAAAPDAARSAAPDAARDAARSAAPDAARDAASSAAAPAQFTLVQLKSGPRIDLTPEQRREVFGGHMANMNRLARAGALLLAGPYGKAKSDPALRGLFVLATADRAEAQRQAETDPGFAAGVFRFELASLATTADLRAQLAADLAHEDAAKAAGRQLGAGDMRGYVLLTAADGDAAAAALAGQPAVLMLGRLDGGRALALLDAKDVAAAETLLAPLRKHLGAFTLDEWWATALLVDLPRRGAR
jgi:uncharacterized protein YciI